MIWFVCWFVSCWLDGLLVVWVVCLGWGFACWVVVLVEFCLVIYVLLVGWCLLDC